MSYCLAIDGNNVLSRAFYAIPYQVKPDSVPKNAVLGFLNIMLKAIADYQPTSVLVCFDCYAPTFRKERYAEYKAGRKKQPDDLTAQFPILKDILTTMGAECLEMSGYEADDILGTIAAKNGGKTLIVSGDKDCLQLLGDKTDMLLLTHKSGKNIDNFYDSARMVKDYCVTPKEFIDVKALMGDSSDNIKGASGIGPKGACDLIGKYGSLEGVYEHLDELKPSQREALENFSGEWQENKFLVTIDKDVPIKIEFKAFCEEDLAKDKFIEKLILEGLPSIAARIKAKFGENEAEQISWF